MRVVSLLPSATELLAALPGGMELLVGRSHECDFPAGLEAVPVLTASRIDPALSPAEVDAAVRAQLGPEGSGASLYTLNAQLLRELRPDVILTQDLCHVCSIDLEAVRSVVSGMPEPRPEIVSLNPTTVEDVLDDLVRVGEAVGRAGDALAAAVALRGRLYRAQEVVNPFADGPIVAALEWTDPLFIAGHWTPQLIERAGGRHPLNPTVPVPGSGAAVGPQQACRRAGKSVRIPPEALVAVGPERLLICPCGVPLAGRESRPGVATVDSMARDLSRQGWFAELPAACGPSGSVALVDGNEMFNRPGPRLVEAFEWLAGWLNDRPELMPEGFPWRALRV